jgi:hypothetical protein
MNEATFPARARFGLFRRLPTTGRMEACGRPEAWKHHVQPSRLDSSRPRFSQPLKPPPLGLPMCPWSKIHFAGKDGLFSNPFSDFWTAGTKTCKCIFIPLPGMLEVSLCHSGRAHGNRAPFLRGRRASSATLVDVPVLDGGGNGMRPRAALWPVWLQLCPTPGSRFPPSSTSLACESSFCRLFQILVFRLFFARKERKQPPPVTASHRGGRCRRVSFPCRRSPAARTEGLGMPSAVAFPPVCVPNTLPAFGCGRASSRSRSANQPSHARIRPPEANRPGKSRRGA